MNTYGHASKVRFMNRIAHLVRLTLSWIERLPAEFSQQFRDNDNQLERLPNILLLRTIR